MSLDTPLSRHNLLVCSQDKSKKVYGNECNNIDLVDTWLVFYSKGQPQLFYLIICYLFEDVRFSELCFLSEAGQY